MFAIIFLWGNNTFNFDGYLARICAAYDKLDIVCASSYSFH